MTQHDEARRGPAPARGTLTLWPTLTVAVLVSLIGMKLSGCAGRSDANGGHAELRLTGDEALKSSPRFSPDGAWIAYAARGATGAFTVNVIASSGGAPRRITPDSLSLVPYGWAADGRSVFCREAESPKLYRVGIDGTVQVLDPGQALTRRIAISADGKTEVLSIFNKDNRDLALRLPGAKPAYLAETPAWEEDATFGPRPGEVTVVSAPSYLAPVNTVSIWSPTNRAFTPIPLPEGRKGEPEWTPDGSLLAYTMVSGGQLDLWTYDPATSRAAPIVEGPEDTSSPTWSPDGQRLAFVRSMRTSHLFAGAPEDPARRQLTEGPDRDYAPLTSPDGQWIAFLRRPAQGSHAGGVRLCVMPARGGEVKELDLKGLALPMAGNQSFAWSNDGRQLAFNASDGASKMDIYRVGRDGSGLARVTVEAGEEVEPQWSPDGRWLSYTQAGSGRLEVVVVPAQGGLPRVLTPPGEKCEAGVWSPGSDRMACVHYRSDAKFEIWIAPVADPGRRRLLTSDETVIWPMYWIREGDAILAMQHEGRNWSLVEISAADGTRRRVGRADQLPSGKDMVWRLLPGNESIARLLYPAGIIVSDGQDRSDLYLIRPRDLASGRLASGNTLRFPWAGVLAPPYAL